MLKIGSGSSVQMTRGDTAYLKINITNDVTGMPYALQNTDTLTLTVKRYVADETPALQKRVQGGDVFRISAEDTQKLPCGVYLYDVQLDTALGDVFTVICAARFELLQEVT